MTKMYKPSVVSGGGSGEFETVVHLLPVGIGHFGPFPVILEIHNCIRSTGLLRDVGRSIVDVLAGQLLLQTLQMEEANVLDIFHLDNSMVTKDVLQGSTLVTTSAEKNSVQLFAHRQCVIGRFLPFCIPFSHLLAAENIGAFAAGGYHKFQTGDFIAGSGNQPHPAEGAI